MKISKITKTKYGYNIYIEDVKTNIETSVFNKFKLKVNDIIDAKKWEEILSLNKIAFIKRKSILYLSSSRSTKEFITYLYKLEPPKGLINSLVLEYTNKGYLDDYLYGELLVKKESLRYGKNRIKEILINKGIKNEIIDELLKDHVDLNLEEQIINSCKNVKANNYIDAKNKLTRSFISKGYSLNLINEYLEKHLDKEEFNENETIKKHYLKALNRYKNKFTGNELDLKIRIYLYNKGYNKETINKIIGG